MTLLRIMFNGLHYVYGPSCLDSVCSLLGVEVLQSYRYIYIYIYMCVDANADRA